MGIKKFEDVSEEGKAKRRAAALKAWETMRLRFSKKEIIGYEKEIKEINDLIKYGRKGIFIGGYHGLGKSSMVYYLAKLYDADVVRLQVTEMLTEVDIVGGVDPRTGGFIPSEFVKALKKANEEKGGKMTFVLLDEFTRGREEAQNILFPLLAEKKLFINSPYADVKVIEVAESVVMFATGNVKDAGLREVGGAEFDRWNGVEIPFLVERNDLVALLKGKAGVTDLVLMEKMMRYYLLTLEKYREHRILAMSTRTFIETSMLAQCKVNDGQDVEGAMKDALKVTYFITSQAILNPNYRKTYEDLIRETGLNEVPNIPSESEGGVKRTAYGRVV